ncbi:LLM class oxidoreductase [Kiloniella sp.]|uniref:LLM class oxidoreductase n=1 Tax=Kiloniella sp. TaxID=1938587 RepID=UPI003A933923
MRPTLTKEKSFPNINQGYNKVFKPGQLSIGLVVPLESYPTGPIPSMSRHIERIQLAEKLGFASVWLRDVPFNVPNFGDAGQLFDPFVYLGALAVSTSDIALGVSSIILPLRHPAHVAKAASSLDQLSNGRLILGVASGDRPDEYPAINIPFALRGEYFRESYDYIRQMDKDFPFFSNAFGTVNGDIDMLPKPYGSQLPLLITGASQQSIDWIAENGDGWMTYPRPTQTQENEIKKLRETIQAKGGFDKPVMEPCYIDLTESPDTPPSPIHLGLRLGVNELGKYLRSRRKIGVNHIALNLRFNSVGIEETLQRLATEILPEFNS